VKANVGRGLITRELWDLLKEIRQRSVAKGKTTVLNIYL